MVQGTVGKVFGVFEIFFLTTALILGLFEARMAVFSGDNQKGYPLFFIVCVLAFVVLLFASRWTTSFACDNDYTVSTGSSNRLCAFTAWWQTFFLLSSSFWYMVMGVTLFGHLYQIRAINNLSTLGVIGVHAFCWGFACLMATVGVTVGGATSVGRFCSIDQVGNNGWWQDGFQTFPVGVFGFAGMIFFIVSIVRVVIVLGAQSLLKYLRLTVMVASYCYVLLYFLGMEVYFRIAIPKFAEGFAAWVTCIALGGTADTCPKNNFLNFGTIMGNEVNLLILCLGIFLLYALTSAPGRFLGLVKSTASGLTGSKDGVGSSSQSL
jgi:hypothetical protein